MFLELSYRRHLTIQHQEPVKLRLSLRSLSSLKRQLRASRRFASAAVHCIVVEDTVPEMLLAGGASSLAARRLADPDE